MSGVSEQEHLKQTATLRDLATKLKEAGNAKLKENKRNEALELYSQGIDAARALSNEKSLLSVLLSNRAHVKMLIGSPATSSLSDCQDAINADSSNLKAFYRAAKCAVVLNDLPKATQFIQRALELDASNETVKQLAEEIAGLNRSFSPDEIETIKAAYMRTGESVLQLQAQLQQSEMEKLKLAKTRQVMEADGSTFAQGRTFLALGKMFLRKERSEVMAGLASNVASLDAKISDLRESHSTQLARHKKAEVDFKEVQKFLSVQR